MRSETRLVVVVHPSPPFHCAPDPARVAADRGRGAPVDGRVRGGTDGVRPAAAAAGEGRDRRDPGPVCSPTTRWPSTART